MKPLLFAALLLIPSPSLAHDIDRSLCGRQEFSHLGLDDREFCRAFVAYWHCRRPLEEKVVEYAWEVGRLNAFQQVLGLPLFQAHPNIIGYFSAIDAEPITQRPGDFQHAAEQIEACEATTYLFQVNIDQVRAQAELVKLFIRHKPEKRK